MSSTPSPTRPRTSTATSRPGWDRDSLRAVALIVLIVLAYLPVWRAGFIWDDDAHVTANPRIIGPEGLREIWTTPAANYFPLVLTTFRAIHAVWGLDPLPYHLANVVLHAVAALLLWRVLRQLAVPGAWLGAAVWALHPVQAESVAWISELKNTQSAVFFLASASFFIRWLKAPTPAASPSWNWHYGAALGCALLALLSKPSTVMLPVLLGLVWWWRHERWSWRAAVLWLAPFFALSALTSGWAIWEQKYHALALGSDWNQSPPERLAIAGRAVWFYIGKLLWPEPLVFVYPRWQIATTSLLAYLPALAVGLTLVGTAWLARSGRRLGLLIVGGFVALLFPVLGFFTVYYFIYSYVADHFQYLASMVALPALVAALVGCRVFARGAPLRLAPVGAAALLAGLGMLTYRETQEYRDSTTLWSATLTRNPSAWIAHINLGKEQFQRGQIDDAMVHYRAALQLRPRDATAHFDLGTAWLAKRDPAQALPEFETAVALDPKYARAHHNLGTALVQLNRIDEALPHFVEAIRLKPNFGDAHRNLAFTLLMLGRTTEAQAHLRTALELNPADARARRALDEIALRTER